jgi:hypothetical protein
MGRKKEYGPKDPGQQFEEIQDAQRKKGRDVIRRIDKSKQRDKEELKQLADRELQRLRRGKAGHSQEDGGDRG